MKLELSRQSSKKSQISDFMKIRLVGAELLHADGQTGMANLTFAFRDFANAHKIILSVTDRPLSKFCQINLSQCRKRKFHKSLYSVCPTIPLPWLPHC